MDKEKSEQQEEKVDKSANEVLTRLTLEEIESIIQFNPTNIDYDYITFQNF